MDKKQLTQVGPALKQLGIRHIPSYTPEGRGRMERVFRTLQQRLPPLLRRAGILTKEAANIWLCETYVQEHNPRFGKAAAEPGSAFVSCAGLDLAEVLCVQEDRQVSRDNCVSWSGQSLQIPEQRHRRHYVTAVVCVHENPDGRLAIFDGPRCLVRFDTKGVQIDEPAPAA